MVIWSNLTQQAWKELQTQGRLRVSRRHTEKDFLGSYLWMASQMERRLQTPRPSEDSMPIWAWWQWWGDRRRPDLRASGYLPKGTRGIRVELRVQADHVLLSDFELWHYVLNYWYLPRTEKEGIAFEKKLTRAGLSLVGCTHARPLPHAGFRREVESSWERIFDLSWTDRRHRIVSASNNRSIQATLWELSMDDVVESKEFVAR